jgi:hypothetical protein
MRTLDDVLRLERFPRSSVQLIWGPPGTAQDQIADCRTATVPEIRVHICKNLFSGNQSKSVFDALIG